jgi:hypothetical protein
MQKRIVTAFLVTTMLAAVLLFARAVQTAKVEGTWYGELSAPDGTPLEFVITVQRQSGGGTATLVIDGGRAVALQDVGVSETELTFMLRTIPGVSPAKSVFNARVVKGREELEGDITLGKTKVHLTMTRNMPAPHVETIDPKELIEIMTATAGPLSERPFVPPVSHPAIEYGIRPPHDPVANLIAGIQAGAIKLKFEGEEGYLHSLLDLLNIPMESQMSVFSKTSVQGSIIGPSNPRKLYFNDAVVVGYVGGGFIEMAAQDPEQGMSFYMLSQEPADKPSVIKRDQCLSCHLTRNSMDIPGMIVRSVYPTSNGDPINPLGSHLRDHRTPFENRFGGWYVTGNTGSMKHLGNTAFTQTGEAQPLSGHYTSDIAAILVFDHQMQMMNLITRVGWDFRLASYLQTALGKSNDTIDRQLRDDVNEFVDYLLFVDEAPLKSRIESTSGFATKFEAAGPKDNKGRSLRQLDLEHRLMRYPCSYMIYSAAFDALPTEAKSRIYARIPEVLNAKFSAADRQAIVEILRDTKKDLAAQLK